MVIKQVAQRRFVVCGAQHVRSHVCLRHLDVQWQNEAADLWREDRGAGAQQADIIVRISAGGEPARVAGGGGGNGGGRDGERALGRGRRRTGSAAARAGGPVEQGVALAWIGAARGSAAQRCCPSGTSEYSLVDEFLPVSIAEGDAFRRQRGSLLAGCGLRGVGCGCECKQL